MNILALDTSDQVLSVALETTGKPNDYYYTEIDAGTRHSELLMGAIDELFKKAALKPAALGLVACMKGPGSFTGLRIGFSTAKGLAQALKIPLVSVPTLDCLAYSLSALPGFVLPAMDAKKGCFFAALYRGGQRITDYLDASPETLAEELTKAGFSPSERLKLTGCGAELLFSRLAEFLPADCIDIDPQARRGRARELLEIAKNGTISSDGVNSGPIYLRKSDAELKMGQSG